MKLFALSIFSGVLFLSSHSQARCLDITGDYDSGFAQEGKGNLIWSFTQKGCASISTGSYYLWGAVKTDEVPLTVNYVHEGHQELCEVSKCFVFTESNSGLEYNWDGAIKVNGAFSCHYSRVEISIDSQNLIRTFYIDDKSPNCRKIKEYPITFKRIQ